jgi:hypothetical protein
MKNTPIKIVAALSFIVISFSFTNPEPKILGVFKAINLVTYEDTSLVGNMFTAVTNLYENPPIEGLIPAKNIQDGAIALNSKYLFYDPSVKMYLDSARRSNLNSINWNLNGAVNLPNFNHTTLKSVPVYTNIIGIPKILDKSQDYILNFADIQNVDKIEFNIVDKDKFPINVPWYRKVPGNIGTLIIPKHQISSFNQNSDLTVIVCFINEEQKTIDGITFVFENRLQIIKKLTVIH